jgi:predicted glycogen debranching enzyme
LSKERSVIHLGPEICRRLDDALAREWLVTNGLGGYASATVAGTPTRRYHGLLVTALRPPVARAVMLAQCDELLTYDGRPYRIATTEYEDGTLDPAGYIHIAAFRLERGLPAVRYEIGDAQLDKQLWMAQGRNTTYVRYTLSARARGPAELVLRPLVNGRPFHLLTRGAARRVTVEAEAPGCVVRFDEPIPPLRLWLTGGRFEAGGDWYWRVLYRRERERGLDYLEDLFSPGVLTVTLPPGGSATLIVSTEPPERITVDAAAAWQAERRRRGELVLRAGLPADDEVGRSLVLAADAFIVVAPPAPAAGGNVGPAPARRAVIAGYHWFAPGGRDALIALPGLTLATGRPDDARAILLDLIANRRDGLVPARYAEDDGLPDHASADTTLWLFVALRAYLQATGDRALLAEVWPALVEMIAAHQHGTRFGIRADPADGLLRAGETGYQLTWMDAKAGDWVVTPRRGKPVEVNALWYSALRQMAEWAAAQAPAQAEPYARLADRVLGSFNQRFWYAPGGYLYDVIDTDGGDDAAFRPNQIMAIGLPFPVLERTRWRPVLDAVTDHLLTPYGLRTLSPGDPHYVGWYAGDAIHRDGAYHQGTVWPWLLGPYLDACWRVYGNRRTLAERLQAFANHLGRAGLGTISEIFDGDPPHSPQGGIADAASVGEVLRLWRAVRAPADDEAPPDGAGRD